MRRVLLTLAIGSTLIAAVAGKSFIDRTFSAGPDADALPKTKWARWTALSNEQRWTHVRRCQDITRKANPAATFAHVRQFAKLPPEGRDRLRRLNQCVNEILAERPKSERRRLLRLPPQARAYSVYELMRSEYPQRLAEFAAPPAGDD